MRQLPLILLVAALATAGALMVVLVHPIATTAEASVIPQQNVYLASHGRVLQQVPSPLNVSLIGAGWFATCAIDTNYDALCWGDVDLLGNGNNDTKGVPSIVGSQKWIEVSGGGHINAGLASDNSFWTWGVTSYDIEDDSYYTYVPVRHGSALRWAQVTAGTKHACGIESQNQSAWCFGSGTYGQLGNMVEQDNENLTRVSGGFKWAQLSAADTHTCGILVDGRAACWGFNSEFVLGSSGIGVDTKESAPIFVTGSNGQTWKSISAGYTHTCAIDGDDDLYCWGQVRDGQRGTTNETESGWKPTQVLPGVKFVDVNAGYWSTSALTTDGEWWGWGIFDSEADKTDLKKEPPKKLADGTNFIQTSGTGDTHCALASNGTLWCTGSNRYKQIGKQDVDALATPTSIKGTWATRAIYDADVAAGEPAQPGSPASPAQPTSTPNGKSPPPVSPSSSNSTGSSTENSDSGGSSSTAAIVGGVVGGIAVVGAGVGGFLLYKKKKRTKAKTQLRAGAWVGDDLESGKSAEFTPISTDDPFIMSSAPSNVSQDAVLRWAASQLASNPPLTRPVSAIPEHVASLAFNWEDCKIIRVLGVGSFGEVFLAQVKHARVAVKVLVDAKALATGSSDPKLSEARSSKSSAVSSVTSASRSTMLKEVSIMASLRHPNVVQLMGFCMEPPCLALEFCARGSLFDVLQLGTADAKAAEALTWQRRIRMATDAAAGLLFLHSRNPQIVHRDVKTPNFLVAVDWSVKVADMGLSKLVEEATGRSMTTAGGASNPRWLSPEVLQGERYTAAADVYSFGIVLWELLMWKLPWVEGDINVWGIVGAVLRGDRPRLPTMEELPGPPPPGATTFQAYLDLMQRCWDQDPEKRPTIQAVADELSRLH